MSGMWPHMRSSDTGMSESVEGVVLLVPTCSRQWETSSGSGLPARPWPQPQRLPQPAGRRPPGSAPPSGSWRTVSLHQGVVARGLCVVAVDRKARPRGQQRAHKVAQLRAGERVDHVYVRLSRDASPIGEELAAHVLAAGGLGLERIGDDGNSCALSALQFDGTHVARNRFQLAAHHIEHVGDVARLTARLDANEPALVERRIERRA
mmetsp:Transcript_1570/g.4206  ORF Transcript_1570/g.4206 Transcript_1570/m.4206 type:complete len:207 (-) Transcript_1570:13-633(-)